MLRARKLSRFMVGRVRAYLIPLTVLMQYCFRQIMS